MAIALLLAETDADQPVIGPEAAGRLTEMGITRVSLIRDASGVGVVLEGWAFDPAGADEAARVVFPPQAVGVRILHEIVQVALSASPMSRAETGGR